MLSLTVAELLAGMVRIDSVNAAVSGRTAPEAELAAWLEQVATNAGLAVERLPVPDFGCNLLLTVEADADDAPWLLFVSHLDTVGVEAMTIDPFEPTIDGGRLYGRGACDTKAGGAAMLRALADYAAAETQPQRVSLLFSVDEEHEQYGVRWFCQHDLPQLGLPDGVIISEPTGLRPVVAHNGVARWTITARGLAAHSSDPGRGHSAVGDMARVITAIEDDYLPTLTSSHPLTGRAQCSLNLIRGGYQANVIPDRCEVIVDRRLVPGEDPSAAYADLAAFIARATADIPRAALELVADAMSFAPLDPTGNGALGQRVGRVLESLGLPGDGVGAKYATEACTLANVPLPCVVLGPGDITQAHTADEWVDLDQVRQAVVVYRRLMLTS